MAEGLVIPAAPTLIRPKRCETCSAWRAPDRPTANGQPQMGQCRAPAPTVTVIPIPTADGRGINPLTFGAWPPTKPDDWCRDAWQPKDKALQ
jgi:hypothetical protein